jgi:hypothetical protein
MSVDNLKSQKVVEIRIDEPVVARICRRRFELPTASVQSSGWLEMVAGVYYCRAAIIMRARDRGQILNVSSC